MMLELELRRVGQAIELFLPKEALARLNASAGDTASVTDPPEASLRIGPACKEFPEQMAAAEDIVRRYRNALRELAR